MTSCVAALLQVQRHLRLCIKRDLTEHDIVSRIMRKDNYLIGACTLRRALLTFCTHGCQALAASQAAAEPIPPDPTHAR